MEEDNPFSHQSTYVVSQGKSYDLMWTFTCGRIRHGIMICRICHLRRISNEFTCRICQMKDFTGFRRISQAKFCVWIYFTWLKPVKIHITQKRRWFPFIFSSWVSCQCVLWVVIICLDVDECESPPYYDCANIQTCMDNYGSCKCRCRMGLLSSGTDGVLACSLFSTVVFHSIMLDKMLFRSTHTSHHLKLLTTWLKRVLWIWNYEEIFNEE